MCVIIYCAEALGGDRILLTFLQKVLLAALQVAAASLQLSLRLLEGRLPRVRRGPMKHPVDILVAGVISRLALLLVLHHEQAENIKHVE